MKSLVALFLAGGLDESRLRMGLIRLFECPKISPANSTSSAAKASKRRVILPTMDGARLREISRIASFVTSSCSQKFPKAKLDSTLDRGYPPCTQPWPVPMSDDELLQLVLQHLRRLGVLRTRRMFGGQYIYCDDLFIATVHDGILYFKANANTAPEFIALKRPVFSYPKNGGIATLQYYQAPREVFESREAMERWGRTALLAARQDAKKAKKKPSRAKPSP